MESANRPKCDMEHEVPKVIVALRSAVSNLARRDYYDNEEEEEEDQ